MHPSPSARSQPAPTPFDFDPFSLTYPALCLRCLHTPPTLFSGQPFSTTTSWSIEAPGPAQLEPLRQYFQETFRRWKSERALTEGRKDHQRNHANGHINGYSHSDQQAQQEQDKVMKHVTSAFNHWKVVPDKQRQESWRLEVLRAYAREQDKQKATATALENAEQEVLHLRAQVDQLSKCQQPREFLLFPPASVPIPQDAVREMSKAGLDFAALDYDSLVDKWKAVIHRHRKSNAGMAAQKPLPADSTPSSSQRTRNFSAPQHGGGPAGAGGMVNGHSALRDARANANADVVDLDEDLEDADADGEGDEPDHRAPQSQSRSQPGHGPGGRAPQAVMDRGVLDPSLQGHGGHGHVLGGHGHGHGQGHGHGHGHADGMVLDGLEGNGVGVGVGGLDAEGFIHGQMLMGLSAGEFVGSGGLGVGVNGDKEID